MIGLIHTKVTLRSDLHKPADRCNIKSLAICPHRAGRGDAPSHLDPRTRCDLREYAIHLEHTHLRHRSPLFRAARQLQRHSLVASGALGSSRKHPAKARPRMSTPIVTTHLSTHLAEASPTNWRTMLNSTVWPMQMGCMKNPCKLLRGGEQRGGEQRIENRYLVTLVPRGHENGEL